MEYIEITGCVAPGTKVMVLAIVMDQLDHLTERSMALAEQVETRLEGLVMPKEKPQAEIENPIPLELWPPTFSSMREKMTQLEVSLRRIESVFNRLEV